MTADVLTLCVLLGTTVWIAANIGSVVGEAVLYIIRRRAA